MTYVTMPWKRDIVAQKKKIKFLMLVSRFSPPLYCEDKTLYAWRDGQHNLPYSSRAVEVKNENMLIEISLQCD